MRTYFKNLLRNLDKLTGMKQYEKLCQTEDPKKEIKTLLDILCMVTDQYTFIPDSDKQKIIDQAVLNDSDFIGLNAKFISRCLNSKKDFYLGKEDDVVIHPEALTGEAAQKRLDEWLRAVQSAEANFTQRTDYYKQIREKWRPKDGVDEYRSTVDEQALYEKERHLQYIQKNYDARTAEKLPDWIPEDEFNKLFDAGLIDL